MQLALLIPEYFLWHYTKALRLTANIVTNFVWFVYHFFSVSILSETLFEPLSGVGKGFSEISRLIGFAVRTGTIFLAYVVMVVLGLAGAGILVAWLLLPIFVGILIYYGFIFLLP